MRQDRLEEYGLPKAATDPYGYGMGPDAGEALDLRGILQFLRRRRWVILGGTVIGAAVALILAFSLQPKYLASATLLLDARKMNVVDPTQQVTAGQTLDSPQTETAVQVLESREVAGRVLDTVYKGKLPQDPPGMLSGLFGSSAPAGPVDARAQREADITGLLNNLQVARAGLTYAININYSAPNPVAAANTANSFAEQYLLAKSGTYGAANSNATKWLAARLASLRQQVVSAEAALQQYRSSNGLLEATPDQMLTQQQISGLDSQLASARADRAMAQASLNAAQRQLQTAGNGDDVGAAVSSSVIGPLRAQRADISGRLADMKSRYGPKYPGLLALQQQLDDINQQITGETRRVIGTLSAQAEAAGQREASLSGSVGQSKAFLARSSAGQVKMNELMRNADSARQVYQSFLDRYRQSAAQQGLDISADRIIGIAGAPTRPSFPKKSLFLVAGLILGSIAGVGLAFFMELMERGLRTPEDVERYLGLKALASVPNLGSTLRRRDQASEIWPPDYVAKAPLSRFTESFRTLVASLGLGDGEKKGPIIVVASTLPGEGKTTTTICLARAAGLAGLSVLVIDCDLRRGELSKLLFGGRKTGVIEVLKGTSTIEEALLPDPIVENVFYLSSLAGEAGAPDIMGMSTLDGLLANVRGRYDLVLVDTAPVLALAETRIIAKKADAVLFIVRWAETAMQNARKAIHDLQDSGANVVGVALTQVDVRKAASAGYGEAMYSSGMSKYYSSEASA